MLLLLVPQTWHHNNICCDPSLIPSMEIIRLNFSPHPNRRSSTYNQYPCYENTSTIKYYFRPKPEKKKIKPIEKPVVDPRKLSEPYTPKPIIRKLPQRKLSDTISLPLHPTYEYLHIMFFVRSFDSIFFISDLGFSLGFSGFPIF